MLYKYIYFRLYYLVRRTVDPSGPQITAAIIMSLLPVLNLYFVLYFLDFFELLSIDTEFVTQGTLKILIIMFFSLLVYNILHFFWINKWREVIEQFKGKDNSNRLNKISKGYIILSISSIIFLYIFDSIV